jgi:hypothetical protein
MILLVHQNVLTGCSRQNHHFNPNQENGLTANLSSLSLSAICRWSFLSSNAGPTLPLVSPRPTTNPVQAVVSHCPITTPNKNLLSPPTFLQAIKSAMVGFNIRSAFRTTQLGAAMRQSLQWTEMGRRVTEGGGTKR